MNDHEKEKVLFKEISQILFNDMKKNKVENTFYRQKRVFEMLLAQLAEGFIHDDYFEDKINLINDICRGSKYILSILEKERNINYDA